VGSNTLKEAGFEDLSSATIRNYFANLEETGFLTQQHSSGGRIPTPKAYKLYANEHKESATLDHTHSEKIQALALVQTKEIVTHLEKMVEELSELTGLAAFSSAPRFDYDTLLDVKVLSIDTERLLAVLITDFGTISTEVIYTDIPVNTFGAKRIENYFKARLLSLPLPSNLTPEEERITLKFYNEAMVRYLVGYSHFTDYDLFKTGFSKLLNYPEFNEPGSLSASLSIFENNRSLRLLLKDCLKHDSLKVWVGDDLNPYISAPSDLSLLAIPYKINGKGVGAVGLLGPNRIPYPQLMGLLRYFSESVSAMLARNIYTFKISVREPNEGALLLQAPQVKLLEVKHDNT
jgi:heat-inducible transcriptional repressor